MKNKKFVMKTYIANKVNGNPLDLDDNYAYWLPINELTKNEKRFAITHLLDDDLINYFESEKINILSCVITVREQRTVDISVQ